MRSLEKRRDRNIEERRYTDFLLVEIDPVNRFRLLEAFANYEVALRLAFQDFQEQPLEIIEFVSAAERKINLDLLHVVDKSHWLANGNDSDEAFDDAREPRVAQQTGVRRSFMRPITRIDSLGLT